MSRPKILLVDDRPEGLLTLEAVLSHPDWDLVKASSGGDALRQLLQDDFAVVLLDVQMPGMDGIETAHLIKMRERSRETPVIFITANHREDAFVFRGYQAGAVDYVAKPFRPEILVSKVAVFVEIFKRRQLMQRDHRRELSRAVSDLDRRYRNLADAIPHILWRARLDGQVEYVNHVWCSVTGLSPDRSQGDGWQSAVHAEDLPAVLDTWREAMEGFVPFEVECRIRGARYAWNLMKGVPEHDSEGAPIAWLLTCVDIDERRRAEERIRFLSEAGASLAESLELDETLETVIRLVSPRLADWCAIELRRPERGPELAAHSQGASSERILEELDRLARELPTVDGAALSRDGASIRVPIHARKRLLGMLTVAASSGRYSERELPLFTELGVRAGLAISNALLYEDAQRAIRARDEFLAIASHELKTPLTPLKIQTQTFKLLADRGQLNQLAPQKIHRMLETSDRQVEKLSSLIDEMLDISRIHIGKLVQEFSEFELCPLFDEVGGRFAAELRNAGCELRVETPGALELCVRWDRARMEQLLANLISNAIKYGPGKPIHLGASIEGELVRLWVRDQGIGIAPEDQPRIFERFERAVSARHFGGLGLGLYISRQIASAHGGTIEVRSRPGEGAEFQVILPADPRSIAVA